MTPANKIKFFKNSLAYRKWLEKNHSTESELWIGFYKKASEKIGITPEEAIEVSLCFGWIDGIRKSIDEVSYCNRFTPRTSKSKWSKINTEKIQRLLDQGLMEPSGLRVVEEAKQDGRWERAYDSPKNAKIPDDFIKQLKKSKKASAAFKNLSRQSLFSINYRLQNSKKDETRDRWIKKIIEKLESGEEFRL